jgi:hypothetical protein
MDLGAQFRRQVDAVASDPSGGTVLGDDDHPWCFDVVDSALRAV